MEVFLLLGSWSVFGARRLEAIFVRSFRGGLRAAFFVVALSTLSICSRPCFFFLFPVDPSRTNQSGPPLFLDLTPAAPLSSSSSSSYNLSLHPLTLTHSSSPDDLLPSPRNPGRTKINRNGSWSWSWICTWTGLGWAGLG